MRDSENILEVSSLKPDFLGFIFYPGSKRFVSPEQIPAITTISSAFANTCIEKVGVFVNEKDEQIEAIASTLGIRILQLHGDESPEQCNRLKTKGFTTIKAFRVKEATDLKNLTAYLDCCDYFLFDTGGKAYGGSGTKFNWEILGDYSLPLPFFLSGGIAPGDIEAITALEHPQFYAVDVNSRFEISPGIKDGELLRSFTAAIRKQAR